jgi:hypothetical protein
MAVLDQLNSDPRFSVTMDLQPGDMQFLNNNIVLHSRTAYEDHPEPECRRDLISLWLAGRRALFRQLPVPIPPTIVPSHGPRLGKCIH